MDDETPELPGSLKLLKTLVTVLTAVMIVGVVTVVGLLVMRLGDQSPVLPASIALPDGARALAFTQGEAWYAIVTDADEILIFDRLSGEMTQRVAITR
ncbi:DUF6476 family protein [Primorskyibacter sp. S187A]|uniref:DUF6476 family protein n=1 Tax=Primorskyibacter sp. S187A TaxID=3415130 RepID=UPI003C7ECD9B